MRLGLTQECFYYKSTLSEKAFNILRSETKKILSNGNESGKESSILTKPSSSGATESFENTTQVNTSSYLSDLIDAHINGRDLSHTKHLLNFVSGEWDTTPCGNFGFGIEKNPQSKEGVVPVFWQDVHFQKLVLAQPIKCPVMLLEQLSQGEIKREGIGIFRVSIFLFDFPFFYLASLSLFSNIYLKTQSCLGTWIPRGKNIPNVCYWNYSGRGENACGKWFKDGETSGSWTLTKQAFKDHFRSRAFYSGLINMSDDLVNVCYQNSVMQCLYNSEFLGRKYSALGTLPTFWLMKQPQNCQMKKNRLSGFFQN